MIPKIKMLGKKVVEWIKGFFQRLKHSQLKEKLSNAAKHLWSSSDNRILLILIAAVLVLLIIAVVLLLGVDWKQTVGICYGADTDPSNAAYRQLLEQSLAGRGFEVIVTDASGDQAVQLQQIQQMKARRCKALAVEPVMVSAGEELSQVLENTGFPTVLLNRQPEGMEETPYVGADPLMPGTLLAQMVLELPDGGDINGDGVVSYLLLQGSEQDSRGTLLSEGFADSVSNSQLLSTQYGNWTSNGGMEACSRELATFGKDIEVILCSNDLMAIGAASAIADGGWQVGKDVYLFGFGGDQACLQLIREKKVTGTVHTDLNEQVSAVVDALLSQLAGQSAKTLYQPVYTPVTAETADQFLSKTE